MARIRQHLFSEVLPNGTVRYRFRKDRTSPRVTLRGAPGDAVFEQNYLRLLAGLSVQGRRKRGHSRYPVGTFGFLVDNYLEDQYDQLENGTVAQATVKQRANLLGRILPNLAVGDLSTLEVRHLKEVVKGFRTTPHQANNLIKTLRSLGV